MCLRPRSHCTGEIWKRTSSLRLGLPSTLIRHDNGAFRKHSSDWRNLKTLSLRFSGLKLSLAFQRWLRHYNHVISLPEVSSNTNPKWPLIVVLSNFSGILRTENLSCVFRVKTPFTNFSGVHVVWTGPRCCICENYIFYLSKPRNKSVQSLWHFYKRFSISPPFCGRESY